MSMTYSVNRDGAIKASGTPRILVKGAYPGVFTRAEAITSSRGTSGIDFSFISDDGAAADFLTIWTVNAKGEDLPGRNQVSALMTCMAVREMTVKRARIEKYNVEAGLRELMDADIFPDLMNKRIGLLLINEEYLNASNVLKTKLVIVNMFDAASGKTAKEIWEKAAARDLPALTAALRDKPLSADKLHAVNPGITARQAATHADHDPFALDQSDEIPF